MIIGTLTRTAPLAWTQADVAAAARFAGFMLLVFGAIGVSEWIYQVRQRRADRRRGLAPGPRRWHPPAPPRPDLRQFRRRL